MICMYKYKHLHIYIYITIHLSILKRQRFGLRVLLCVVAPLTLILSGLTPLTRGCALRLATFLFAAATLNCVALVSAALFYFFDFVLFLVYDCGHFRSSSTWFGSWLRATTISSAQRRGQRRAHTKAMLRWFLHSQCFCRLSGVQLEGICRMLSAHHSRDLSLLATIRREMATQKALP